MRTVETVIDDLLSIENLRPVGRERAAFRTEDRKAMARAQKQLEAHGFLLGKVDMIEGAFYQLRYNNTGPFDEWPYWVVLQLDAKGVTRHFPLGLFYYDEGDSGRRVLRRWSLGYTFGTQASEAEKLLVDFDKHASTSVAPFWVPLFDD